MITGSCVSIVTVADKIHARLAALDDTVTFNRLTARPIIHIAVINFTRIISNSRFPKIFGIYKVFYYKNIYYVVLSLSYIQKILT